MPSILQYGRQSLDDTDIQAVVEALRSDYLTCGPKVAEFERAFADFVGARHAVSASNATAALHLAMLVAGIGPGHRVVTSPNTFLASANCAAFVGAVPDFSDIDPVSYNLDASVLEAGWQPDTRAVVAVDYAGQVANLPEISRVARERGAIVIEDACHGVGGAFRHDGQIWRQGGNPWADMAVFSFHPVKTMTTGEGGMLVTDNDEFARRARLLRAHGMERESGRFVCFGQPDDPLAEAGPWAYEMQELGFNFRLTDIQCALGLSQLRRLPGFLARRREIVARYNQAFAGLPWLVTPGLRPPAVADLASWHLYTVQIDFAGLGITRRQAMEALRQKGVGSQVLYIPVHLQPWYRRTYGYGPGKCRLAEALYQRCLSLPLYPSMTDEEVDRVTVAVRALFIDMNTLAVIPARGGSKRIPRKNLRPFCGRPMIGWAIEAARACGAFDDIIVSTDDDEIAKVAESEGAQSPFRRPPHLADDHTPTLPVIAHALDWWEEHRGPVGLACCIYATAPFLQPRHLIEGRDLLRAHPEAEFAFSICSYAFPVFRALRCGSDGRVAMLWPENELKRSQDLPDACHDAGQFYWGWPASFRERSGVFSARSLGVRLPRHLVQDIDTPEDWERAELMFAALPKSTPLHV